MEHIQKIREACIAANPEIMELKFGCEVYRGADTESKEIVVGFFNDKIALVRRHPIIGDFLPFEVPRELEKGWTILGRPIRLADIFNMLSKLEDKIIYKGHMSFTNRIVYYWNLEHDDLSQQPPEALRFIAELLTN